MKFHIIAIFFNLTLAGLALYHINLNNQLKKENDALTYQGKLNYQRIDALKKANLKAKNDLVKHQQKYTDLWNQVQQIKNDDKVFKAWSNTAIPPNVSQLLNQ